ncbi:MAG TPA: hypothetical protein VK698_35410 [Kofleriaceae bacterium]|nr:hypothetical protein [Kofleriaceae bacterium]
MSGTDTRELMAALAEIIRDERLREELERMAAGQLGEAEQVELERRARSDPALRDALALCRPPAPGFHERLARAALVSLGGAREAAQEPAQAAVRAPAASSSAASPSGRDPTDADRSEADPTEADAAGRRRAVTAAPRPPRWRRRTAWAAAGTALAAAAGLLLVGRGRGDAIDLRGYRLEVSGASEFRGEPGAPFHPGEPRDDQPVALIPGGRIQIVLRPSVRTSAPVDAWFFVERANQIEPISLTVEVDRSGAIRATGVAGAWGDDARLVVALGPPGRAPALDDARARAGGWRWLTRRLRLAR